VVTQAYRFALDPALPGRTRCCGRTAAGSGDGPSAPDVLLLLLLLLRARNWGGLDHGVCDSVSFPSLSRVNILSLGRANFLPLNRANRE
jgi:hypothetical protein